MHAFAFANVYEAVAGKTRVHKKEHGTHIANLRTTVNFPSSDARPQPALSSPLGAQPARQNHPPPPPPPPPLFPHVRASTISSEPPPPLLCFSTPRRCPRSSDFLPICSTRKNKQSINPSRTCALVVGRQTDKVAIRQGLRHGHVASPAPHYSSTPTPVSVKCKGDGLVSFGRAVWLTHARLRRGSTAIGTGAGRCNAPTRQALHSTGHIRNTSGVTRPANAVPLDVKRS